MMCLLLYRAAFFLLSFGIFGVSVCLMSLIFFLFFSIYFAACCVCAGTFALTFSVELAYSFQLDMASNIQGAFCIICKKTDSNDNLHELTERGQLTILAACEVRDDSELRELIASLTCSNTSYPLYVHNACRLSYTDTRKLKRMKVDDTGEAEARPGRSLR